MAGALKTLAAAEKKYWISCQRLIETLNEQQKKID